MVMNIDNYPNLNEAEYTQVFMEAYNDANNSPEGELAQWKELFTEQPTLDPKAYVSYLSDTPPMREMKADHPKVSGTEQGYEIKKKEYQSEETIKRSQLNASNGKALFDSTVRRLAQRAAEFKIDLIRDLIMTGAAAGSIGMDGVPYFAANHTFGASGAQSNTGALAFNAANVTATKALFRSLVSNTGRAIGGRPTHCLVCPTLEDAGITLFNPNLYIQPPLNFNQTGVVSPAALTTPRTKVFVIDGTENNVPTATEWYLFKASATVKPFIVVQTGDPVIEVTSMDADDWKVRKFLTVTAYWEGRVAYGPWFYGYKGNV